MRCEADDNAAACGSAKDLAPEHSAVSEHYDHDNLEGFDVPNLGGLNFLDLFAKFGRFWPYGWYSLILLEKPFIFI